MGLIIQPNFETIFCTATCIIVTIKLHVAFNISFAPFQIYENTCPTHLKYAAIGVITAFTTFPILVRKIKVLYKNVCKLTKGLKASSEIIPLISRRNIHHLDIHNPCVSQF